MNIFIKQFLKNFLNEIKNVNSKKIVGNDRGENGCIPSAGYTWCPIKKKCVRMWEIK